MSLGKKKKERVRKQTEDVSFSLKSEGTELGMKFDTVGKDKYEIEFALSDKEGVAAREIVKSMEEEFKKGFKTVNIREKCYDDDSLSVVFELEGEK